MTIPSTQIGPTGAVVPAFSDVLNALIETFQSIYGTDVALTPNTQDGQWLGVLAQAISDNNQLAAAVYNAFSPIFAQGVGLSSVVKINGIRRNVPTASTCVVTITGTVGTQINNGQVGDNQNLGTRWALPFLVTIPPAGTIDVTATSLTDGAVTLGANQLNVILTPTLGWQTATNGSNVPAPGAAVESDAALRRRQTASTGLPATTPLAAIQAAVANVSGVLAVKVYNNDTGAPDGNGIPGHSISAVVEGGDATAVATAIFDKKSEATGTFGTTSITVIDQNGMPDTINFFEVAFTDIWAIITVTPLAGFNTSIGDAIVAAVVNYINSLPIGGTVVYFTLAGIATLQGTASAGTFTVEAVTVGTAPSPVGTVDVPIDFNKRASTITADVSLVT
jgi:hypothetical protein